MHFDPTSNFTLKSTYFFIQDLATQYSILLLCIYLRLSKLKKNAFKLKSYILQLYNETVQTKFFSKSYLFLIYGIKMCIKQNITKFDLYREIFDLILISLSAFLWRNVLNSHVCNVLHFSINLALLTSVDWIAIRN